MELNVFSVRDEKADTYGTPFFAPNKGIALRSFQDLVNDPQTTVFKHPSDYRLFLLGTYNDIDGRITGLKAPEYIAQAIDFIPVKK